jgi:hypothetical protein
LLFACAFECPHVVFLSRDSTSRVPLQEFRFDAEQLRHAPPLFVRRGPRNSFVDHVARLHRMSVRTQSLRQYPEIRRIACHESYLAQLAKRTAEQRQASDVSPFDQQHASQAASQRIPDSQCMFRQMILKQRQEVFGRGQVADVECDGADRVYQHAAQGQDMIDGSGAIKRRLSDPNRLIRISLQPEDI